VEIQMLDEIARLSTERRLFRHHLVARMAYAKALGRQGLLAAEEVNAVVLTLAALPADPPELSADSGQRSLQAAVDAELASRLGPLADKLASTRSYHDQAATDTRLWAREAILGACAAIVSLQRALLAVAERHGMAAIPGYTHLQRAGPLLLGHHLLAYLEMFYRDGNRLRETYVRADILPLGAGELAGAPYPLDRAYLAGLLGMHTSTRNSLDAVGDRDYIVEHVAHLAMVAMHLSRMAEELVLWSSAEFGFVELDESFTTGSSMMPPKRNPDVAELVRSKTGRVYGALVAVLTTMKALPLSYSRDLQELAAPYFDAADTVTDGLTLCAAMLAGNRWRTDRMAQATIEAVGPNVTELLARHDIHGGTAAGRVRAAIRDAYTKVEGLWAWVEEKRAPLPRLSGPTTQ